jgi:hypothetical protein
MDATNPKHAKIANYLKIAAGGNKRVAELLWCSVGRVWLKSSQSDLVVMVAWMADIDHIADWLKVAVLDNARWLSNLDAMGRPKKLMKFGTLEAIRAEANRQMQRKQEKQAATQPLSEEDELVHFELEGGWRIVRMLSERALDRESELMQHCIGHGGYDDTLRNEDTLLLSLRDPSGKPHVTIEIEDGELSQFQGKQNKVPLDKYIVRCLPFLNHAGVECNSTGFLVRDVAGAVYSVSDLPDSLTVSGNLLVQARHVSAIRLPKKITADGNVTIVMDAETAGFLNVPEVLHVGGNLSLSGPWINRLPKSLTVGGSLQLSHSAISHLPTNLSVTANLSLCSTPIRNLPAGLRVANEIDLRNTDVEVIPSDLRCRSINIAHTKIKRFDTCVFIDDEPIGNSRSLNASSSLLEEIIGVPNFSTLDVADTPISVLPSNLVVTKNLHISGTPIRKLPATVKLGGFFAATRCEIEILLPRMSGNVDFSGSKIELPSVFCCKGELNLSGAEVLRMPRYVKAANFRMAHGTVDKFPNRLEAGLVDVSGIRGCQITGIVKARKLRISQDISILGDHVQAAEVEVVINRSLYSASLEEVRMHLDRHGNLTTPPKEAREKSFMVAGVRTGKTLFMSRLLNDFAGGRDRPLDLIYATPPFV